MKRVAQVVIKRLPTTRKQLPDLQIESALKGQGFAARHCRTTAPAELPVCMGGKKPGNLKSPVSNPAKLPSEPLPRPPATLSPAAGEKDGVRGRSAVYQPSSAVGRRGADSSGSQARGAILRSRKVGSPAARDAARSTSNSATQSLCSSGSTSICCTRHWRLSSEGTT